MLLGAGLLQISKMQIRTLTINTISQSERTAVDQITRADIPCSNKAILYRVMSSTLGQNKPVRVSGMSDQFTIGIFKHVA